MHMFPPMERYLKIICLSKMLLQFNSQGYVWNRKIALVPKNLFGYLQISL